MDFANVDITGHAGLPKDGAYAIQVMGRTQRDMSKIGLYIIFYEPWVKDIDIKDFFLGVSTDPDRPRKPLEKNSTPRLRAPFFSVSLVQSDCCIRDTFAKYLGDSDPKGIVLLRNFMISY